LDNTYIDAERLEFPPREESLANAVALLRELLFSGAQPIVIAVPKVGREQFLVGIAKQLQRKIYVDDVRYEIAEILGLSEYFTTNRDDASIWACNRRTSRAVLHQPNSHAIEASMLFCIRPAILRNNERLHCIEYSDHCSPNELCDFLSHISFSKIVALAVRMTQEHVGLAFNYALHNVFGPQTRLDANAANGTGEQQMQVDEQVPTTAAEGSASTSVNKNTGSRGPSTASPSKSGRRADGARDSDMTRADVVKSLRDAITRIADRVKMLDRAEFECSERRNARSAAFLEQTNMLEAVSHLNGAEYERYQRAASEALSVRLSSLPRVPEDCMDYELPEAVLDGDVRD
uniref:DRMBL domain-containing protein n=1 Tax=Gongylonema pulchrum TaxID=637853 RepID=A0A183E9P3_9BILA